MALTKMVALTSNLRTKIANLNPTSVPELKLPINRLIAQNTVQFQPKLQDYGMDGPAAQTIKKFLIDAGFQFDKKQEEALFSFDINNTKVTGKKDGRTINNAPPGYVESYVKTVDGLDKFTIKLTGDTPEVRQKAVAYNEVGNKIYNCLIGGTQIDSELFSEWCSILATGKPAAYRFLLLAFVKEEEVPENYMGIRTMATEVVQQIFGKYTNRQLTEKGFKQFLNFALVNTMEDGFLKLAEYFKIKNPQNFINDLISACVKSLSIYFTAKLQQHKPVTIPEAVQQAIKGP